VGRFGSKSKEEKSGVRVNWQESGGVGGGWGWAHSAEWRTGAVLGCGVVLGREGFKGGGEWAGLRADQKGGKKKPWDFEGLRGSRKKDEKKKKDWENGVGRGRAKSAEKT